MSDPFLPTISIVSPHTSEGLDEVRQLFIDYQRVIGIDLTFQGFDDELAALPGHYSPPSGGLFVARVDGRPAGCCAFRPLHNVDHTNACEMKRLFVRKAFHGLGLGRLLIDHTLMGAKQAGYDHMLLDTLSDMETARRLYQEAGFAEIPPYYHNPLPGAHYLCAKLT